MCEQRQPLHEDGSCLAETNGASHDAMPWAWQHGSNRHIACSRGSAVSVFNHDDVTILHGHFIAPVSVGCTIDDRALCKPACCAAKGVSPPKTTCGTAILRVLFEARCRERFWESYKLPYTNPESFNISRAQRPNFRHRFGVTELSFHAVQNPKFLICHD